MVIVLHVWKGFRIFNFIFIVFVGMLDKRKCFWFYARQKGKHLQELMLPRLCMIFIRSHHIVVARLACTDTFRGRDKKQKWGTSMVLERQGNGEREGQTGIMVDKVFDLRAHCGCSCLYYSSLQTRH